MRSFSTPHQGLSVLGTDDCLAFWRCNEGAASSNFTDAVGTYTLTQHGNPSVVASLFAGTTTGARSISSTKWADVASDAAMRALFGMSTTPSEGYTFECLFSCKGLPSSGQYETLFCLSAYEATPTSAGNVLASLRITDAGKLQWRAQKNTATDITVLGTKTISTQVTYYCAVAVSQDPADSAKLRVRIYLAPAIPSTSSLIEFGKFLDIQTDGVDKPTGGGSAIFALHGCWRDSADGGVTPGSKGSDLTIFDDVRVLKYAASEDALRDSYARCFRGFDENRIIESNQYASRVDVQVETADGAWVSLSDAFGYDFVSDVSVGMSADDDTMSANITLARQIYRYDLSPYAEGSRFNNLGGAYEPLIQGRRRLKVLSSITPRGWENVGYEERCIFEGFIDEVNPAANNAEGISVVCRGLDAAMQDTFIKQDRDYDGDDLETVLQNVISDNEPTKLSPLFLFVRDASGFATSDYKQEQTQLSEALSTLADAAAGMTIRFEWDDARQQHRLTLRDVPREDAWDGTNQARVLTADEILEISDMTEIVSDVRNDVTVTYLQGVLNKTISSIDNSGPSNQIEITTSTAHGLVAGNKFRVGGTTNYNCSYTVLLVPSTTTIRTVETLAGSVASESTGTIFHTDDEGNPFVQTIAAEDAASIARYGRMSAQIVEGAESVIDTAEEATAFLTSILSDLADPFANISITIPFDPRLELYDIVQINGDLRLPNDEDIGASIVNIEHAFSLDNGAQTRLQLRGRGPIGRRTRWLERLVGRLTGRPQISTFSEGIQGGVALDGIGRGARARWTQARRGKENAFDQARVYVSTSTGFVPNLDNIHSIVRGNSVVLSNLTPEVPNYIVLQPVDQYGNVGPHSSEVAYTPKYTNGIVPRASAYRSTSNQTGFGTTAQKCAMNAEKYDKTADYDHVTNYRFTAKSTGNGYGVSVKARCHFDMAGKPNEKATISIRRYNASNTLVEELFSIDAHDSLGSTQIHVEMTVSLDLNAGDYIELWAVLTATGSLVADEGRSYLMVSFEGERS